MKRVDHIPLDKRIELRHTLQINHSRCLELRGGLGNGHANLEGALTDARQILGDIQNVVNVLERSVRTAPDVTPVRPRDWREEQRLSEENRGEREELEARERELAAQAPVPRGSLRDQQLAIMHDNEPNGLDTWDF